MKTPETTQDQFMRIAMARLQKDYRFFPQRVAIAARMYRSFLDRQRKREIVLNETSLG